MSLLVFVFQIRHCIISQIAGAFGHGGRVFGLRIYRSFHGVFQLVALIFKLFGCFGGILLGSFLLFGFVLDLLGDSSLLFCGLAGLLACLF